MIDRSSDVPDDSTSDHQSQLACSFCGKGRDEVRALITGSQVCICDECVAVCEEVLEKEETLPIGDSAIRQATLFNLATDCVLCRMPAPIEDLLPIPERGFLCTACLGAIRLAAGQSENT